MQPPARSRPAITWLRSWRSVLLVRGRRRSRSTGWCLGRPGLRQAVGISTWRRTKTVCIRRGRRTESIRIRGDRAAICAPLRTGWCARACGIRRIRCTHITGIALSTPRKADESCCQQCKFLHIHSPCLCVANLDRKPGCSVIQNYLHARIVPLAADFSME